MSPPAQQAQQSTTHTVLVVEDELMVRMPIAEYLRDCGYHVLEASDAADAIATLETSGPVSLVFSDVRMPGRMDGFDLARWFHQHHPDIPVLLTSGYNTGRGTQMGPAGGAMLIQKPYSQAQVAHRIARMLGDQI